MAEELKISYQIFLEAEDVSCSRIASCTSFAKNIIANHKNPYINVASFDDESDMDDFALRFYVDETIEEAECKNHEAAEGFADNLIELLDEIAHMHSFLDMEGKFTIAYEGEILAYTFASESGSSMVEFWENKDTE